MNLPIIVIHNFMKFSENEMKIMSDDCIFSRNEALKYDKDSYTTNTPVTRDTTGNFSKLYDHFFKKSEKIFKKIDLLEENSTTCHCLCQNNEFWQFHPHIHTRCDINSVYYLKIPKKSGRYCAPIVFSEDPSSGKWEQFQPVPDDLIIFPGNLWHDPLFNSTDDWRISINMEIQCKNPPTWSDFNINKS